MIPHLDRRHLLRGAGVSLALPWLEMMAPRAAQAGTSATPPRRFVTFFQPNGVYPKAWNVKGQGKGFRVFNDTIAARNVPPGYGGFERYR